MSITDKTRKLLWGGSGNRCAFCRGLLRVEATAADDVSIVGEECHIISGRENGPRYDPDFPRDQIDDYSNLILLCRVHHKMVDDQENTFTPEVLRKLKADHEELVRVALIEPNVSKAEALARFLVAHIRDRRMETAGLALTAVADELRLLSRWEPWLTERRYLSTVLARRQTFALPELSDAINSARHVSLAAYEQLVEARTELDMLTHAISDVQDRFLLDTSGPVRLDRTDEYVVSLGIAGEFLRNARLKLEDSQRELMKYIEGGA